MTAAQNPTPVLSQRLAGMLAHDHEHRVDMAALWPPGDA